MPRSIKDLFTIQPDIGAATPEPSLEDLIYYYYDIHDMSAPWDLTNAYIKQLIKQYEEE